MRGEYLEMPKKTKSEIEAENRELKEQLRQSVSIIEGLRKRVDASESSSYAIEGPPSRNLYGVDEAGVPYSGISFSMDAKGRVIRKVSHEKSGEVDRALKSIARQHAETDALLWKSRAEIFRAKDALKAAENDPRLALGRAIRREKERKLSVGSWDAESKTWKGGREPAFMKVDAIGDAKTDVQFIEKTRFEGTKSSVWDPELAHWRGDEKRPSRQKDMSVGEYDPDRKEWKGQDVDEKNVADMTFVHTPFEQILIPPDEQCPYGVPTLMMGIAGRCITEACRYLRWCQSRGSPEPK